MTPPEDKAPDMPSEIWAGIYHYDNEVDSPKAEWRARKITGSEKYWHDRIMAEKDRQIASLTGQLGICRSATLPPQSPDQGAVEEALAWARMMIIPVKQSGEARKPLETIIALLTEQALTRPPLDLAETKMEITKAALAGEVFIINLQDIDATLDHLQAIRPDIFGGKKDA